MCCFIKDNEERSLIIQPAGSQLVSLEQTAAVVHGETSVDNPDAVVPSGKSFKSSECRGPVYSPTGS